MTTSNGKSDGDHAFENDATFDGMIAGTATVAAGVHLVLNGMVTGDLVVESDATVEIDGMVSGNVLNQGGSVRVAGTVGGAIIVVSGDVDVHPDAKVRGGVVRRNG